MKKVFLATVLAATFSQAFAWDCFKRDYTNNGATEGADIGIYSSLYDNAQDGGDINRITYEVLDGAAFDVMETASLADISKITETKVREIRVETYGKTASVRLFFKDLDGSDINMLAYYNCDKETGKRRCEDTKGSLTTLTLNPVSGTYDIVLKNNGSPMFVHDHVGSEAMDLYEYIANDGKFRAIKSDTYYLKKLDCTEENGFF